jgi:hypothetical protein
MITSVDIEMMEKSARALFNFASRSFCSLAIWAAEKVSKLAESPRVQNAVLFFILFNNRVQTNCYLFFKHVYDENQIIRAPVDFALWSYGQVELMNLNHRVEPNVDSWLNVCSSVRIKRGVHVNKSPCRYLESYSHLSDKTLHHCTFKSPNIGRFISGMATLPCAFEMRKGVNSLKNKEKDEGVGNTESFIIACESNANLAKDNSDYEDDDTVVIMKQGCKYKVSIANLHQSREDPYNFTLAKSNVRFLGVEYCVESKNIIVPLKLQKGMYIQENELFSPAFVRRMLEYQSEYFEFEMDYTLNIIDGEVHNFALNNNQYIVLRENEYEVKELYTDEDLHIQG